MVQDALSTVSLLLMLMLRSFIHKPIFKCFIHTLRDTNPRLAQQVRADFQSAIYNATRQLL